MIKLSKENFPKALALFKHSRHQMKLTALAESRIQAQVWADAPEPSVAAVLYKNKMLVASRLAKDALVPILRPFLLEQAYEKKMGCGAGEALVVWDGENTGAALAEALKDKFPAMTVHEYYELSDPVDSRKAAPPEEYELRLVDGALLKEGLVRTEELREEMCSERTSVEAFLAESFGVCAVSGNELAGWCLSEYNCSQGCEVGIASGQTHRRRGVARAMVSAFAEEAARRGVGKIGWHCFKNNAASSATALSAGFRKSMEYGELMYFFEPAVQYAVNGDLCDDAGSYADAVGWYEKSLELPGAPLWVYVRLAMAYTALGRFGEAMGALRAAVGKGFSHLNWLRNEPRLEPLRGEEDWKQLF